jgi:hypothetical protein
LDDFIGALAVGQRADLTVLKAQHEDPHERLLRTHLPDVEMVWVGGNLLYADEGIPAHLKPEQYARLLVQGVQKRLCVADPQNSVPKSAQTLQEIGSVLQAHDPQLAPLVS